MTTDTLDLISRKALFHAIEESLEINPHKDPSVRTNHRSEHFHFLRMVAMSPACGPRWVSVDEKLPEKGGSYLVCTNRGAVFTAHFYASGATWSGRAGKHIAFWMPMPGPPEELI